VETKTHNISNSYLQEVGIFKINEQHPHILLGPYDGVEDQYEASLFDGNTGYVKIKVNVLDSGPKDDALISKMVMLNAALNQHARLLNYEVSEEGEDSYFDRVTVKINYSFEPEEK